MLLLFLLFLLLLSRFLLFAWPPDMLFGEDRGRPVVVATWTEEVIRSPTSATVTPTTSTTLTSTTFPPPRVCLHLYLAILPLTQKLLPHLAEVGGDTASNLPVSTTPATTLCRCMSRLEEM